MASFSTCTNPIIHLLYPPKVCIIIVCNFSWDMKMAQGKSKTMPMHIFRGVEAVYYGIVQIENWFNKTKFLLGTVCLAVPLCTPLVQIT